MTISTPPPSEPEGSDARKVRDLVRGATTATLATLDQGTGHPYASLVEVATLPDGRPVMLLSGLARPCRNLKADQRATLLFDQRAWSSRPLTALRAALIGRVTPVGDPSAQRRYLARFPEASGYASFSDFQFWALSPEIAHVVAGFGRIGEIGGTELVLGGNDLEALASVEALIATVNDLAEQRQAACLAVDIEGADFRTVDGLRRALVDLRGQDEKSSAETVFSAIAQCSID
ncbi:MAG: pyridoxamine 5'-phosphate oxidase family protein [Hyphomicrobiaceae bacterium]